MTNRAGRGLPGRRDSRRTAAPGVAATLMVFLLAATLSACGGTATPATAKPAGADVPMPNSIKTLPESPAPPVTGCLDSLRPGPLPSPGAMPPGSTMARIQTRGYLIAGVDEDSYLFGYRNPSTDPTAPPLIGFDIDFVRQVSTAIFGSPDRVHYRIITKAERLTVLQKGEVDLVADILTVDCERRKQADFSADYFDAGQRVLVEQSSTAQGIADLVGKKVCAAAGTTSIQTLADPKFRVVPVSAVNWADCLVLLQQGQVDAISTTDLILLGIQSQDPYTKIVGPRLTAESHGLGIPQHEEDFVRFVNGVLEKVKADGTWKDIYSRWVGDRLGPVPDPPAPIYR